MADYSAVSLLLLLPAEIQRLILDQLDRKTLFNLRVTCKALCYQATPIAFRELHVWLEEESLQKLVNIAHMPHLRTCVKRLGFGMDAFYDASFRTFERFVFPNQVDNFYAFPQRKIEAALLKPAWRVYRRYYKKQRALEESRKDLVMLTKAVASFSSLERIDLIDYQAFVDGAAEGPTLLRDQTSLRQHMLNVPNPTILVPRGGRQLQVLIRVLGIIDRKLQELTLHLWSSNISVNGFYSPLSAKNIRFAWSAFAGLKKLGLCLFGIRREIVEDCRERSEELSLTTVLRAAAQLESLWLELPRVDTNPPPGVCWKNIIQVQSFGKLKELSIEGATLDEAEFVSFLLHSCQGLESLNLMSATVVEGRWDLILETIRGLPKLQWIFLEDLWYEHSRSCFIMPHNVDLEPLYDYILKRRTDNPWQSMCQAQLARYEEEDTDTDTETSEDEDQ